MVTKKNYTKMEKREYITLREAHIIIDFICSEYLITIEEIKGDSRVNEISEPRAILCYILYGIHGFPPSSLGRLFNKVHGNIITTSKRVEEEMKHDKRYKEKIERLMELVTDIYK